ncbi:MAG: MotA/TolQ/ExbB proton channel family protein [Novosphingobium sp.]
MNLANLVDGPSAVIVFGGTFVGTLLRSGRRDVAETLRALGQLRQRRFDAERVRAELALQVQEIRQDGILRAKPHTYGDREFDEATGALLERRSVAALLASHEAHKARRQTRSHAAVRTLAQATELAPVFGLAGTLISLSQLPGAGIGAGSYAATIAMAVLSTLYGLLAANLLLGPLARVVARAAEREEAERQKVVDWLAEQVAAACKTTGDRGHDKAVAA